jgi:protein SCO1/2
MFNRVSAFRVIAAASIFSLLAQVPSQGGPNTSGPRSGSSFRSQGELEALSKPGGADFNLTDDTGHKFNLAAARGKVILLFFGYTSCAEACPATMAKLARVYKNLGAAGADVLTLFISVDPDRDTAQALHSYLKYFKINSLGLTGTKEELDKVVKQYGARYEIEKSDSAMGYHINHSTFLYLIDQHGSLSHRFQHLDGPELIQATVQNLTRGNTAN